MTALDDILEHHGVKGMKWGVRNDRGHEGEQAKTKKIARLDKRFARRSQSVTLAMAIYNDAAHTMNDGVVDRINNKPQYRDADLRHDTPLSRKYNTEMHDAFIKALSDSANARGTNASGTKKYSIKDNGPDGLWDITVTDVKHADGLSSFQVKVTRDAKGFITNLEVLEPDTMAQSEAAVQEFLEHFGVKGMRWGQRRGNTPAVPVAADHVHQVELKQRAKAGGGTKALSNKELQDYITRVNLERQFKAVQPGAQVGKFVSDLLVGVGKQQITRVAQDAAGKQVGNLLKKKS